MDQRIEAILKKAADEIYSIGVKDGAETARITLIAQRRWRRLSEGQARS